MPISNKDVAPNGANKGEDEVAVKGEGSGCSMLLEVKSVTLAMKGAAEGEVGGVCERIAAAIGVAVYNSH